MAAFSFRFFSGIPRIIYCIILGGMKADWQTCNYHGLLSSPFSKLRQHLLAITPGSSPYSQDNGKIIERSLDGISPLFEYPGINTIWPHTHIYISSWSGKSCSNSELAGSLSFLLSGSFHSVLLCCQGSSWILKSEVKKALNASALSVPWIDKLHLHVSFNVTPCYWRIEKTVFILLTLYVNVPRPQSLFWLPLDFSLQLHHCLH